MSADRMLVCAFCVGMHVLYVHPLTVVRDGILGTIGSDKDVGDQPPALKLLRKMNFNQDFLLPLSID